MTLVIGLVIGLVLGLTGAGGSVLAVPLLMSQLHLTLATSSGLALGAVSLAAWFGVLLRGRQSFHGLLVLSMAVSGSLFSPVGQLLAQRLPEPWLMRGFALLAGIIAWRMWRQARLQPASTHIVRAGLDNDVDAAPICQLTGKPLYRQHHCLLRLAAAGALTGLLSGLFGVGGGFVIVPLLVLLTGLDMRAAVATSLGVIALVSSSGFISFIWRHPVSWAMLTPLLLGAVTGMSAGTVLAKYIAGPQLQRGFALVIGVMTVYMVIHTGV